jgi:mRNA-degrading endonuclease RelE of RelBE toxin-antitoxin system
MTGYRIEFENSALDDWKSLSAEDRNPILESIKQLRKSPQDVGIKLDLFQDLFPTAVYVLVVGEFRVYYQILDNRKLVRVIGIEA